MHIFINKFIINNRSVINILLCVLLVLPLALRGQAKKITRQQLAATSVHRIDISGYTITKVLDARANKDMLQEQYQPFGDISDKLKKYIEQNYLFNNIEKEVRLDIEKLAYAETKTATQVNGILKVSFSFDVNSGNEIYENLTSYNWSISYVRLPAQVTSAESYIDEGLKNALKYFDDWYNKNKGTNSLLARGIELKFSNYAETPEGDTIYYSPKRPLTWADFKDKPQHGIYAAQVFPGFGITQNSKVTGGIVEIEMGLKVYLPKSAAWVKQGEETDLNLNHEQRHFDIVELVAERFKKKLLKEGLPVYNYEGVINTAYFDALRELTDLQKQYDQQTMHGANYTEQKRWNKIIDEELNIK